jgi:hypothetical protein
MNHSNYSYPRGILYSFLLRALNVSRAVACDEEEQEEEEEEEEEEEVHEASPEVTSLVPLQQLAMQSAHCCSQ